MASSLDFIEFICEQISSCGIVTYKKMFGEYMVYANGKPIILICNDTPYVKSNEITDRLIKNKEIGEPYKGAKPHYILDIDDKELACSVAIELEKITPLPKPKKKKIGMQQNNGIHKVGLKNIDSQHICCTIADKNIK